MAKYWIWDDYIGSDDAIEFFSTCTIEEGVVEDALAILEEDGYFTDGYPQSVVYYVQNEEGKVTKYSVDTEFEPCFVVTKKENEK